MRKVIWSEIPLSTLFTILWSGNCTKNRKINNLLKSLSVNLEMLSSWKIHPEKIQLWFFSAVFLSSHQKWDLPLVPTAECFSSVQNGLNEAGGDILCPNSGKLNVGGYVFTHVLFLGWLVCEQDDTKRVPCKTRMVDESQRRTHSFSNHSHFLLTLTWFYFSDFRKCQGSMHVTWTKKSYSCGWCLWMSTTWCRSK